MDNGNRTPLLRLYYETSQLRNTNWSQLDDMIGNAFQPGSPIQLPPGYANPPTTGLVYGRGGTSIPSIAWRPVLPLAGGAMAGDIVLARDPTTAMMAVTKQYVDVVFATTGVYRGDWQVAANTPDLNALVPAPAPGDRWMALTVDPNVPEFPPAGIPGIDPAVRISQGTWIQRNATNDAWFVVIGGQLTKFEADQYYVNVTGDTMSGGLVISMNGPLLTYHETNLINPALGGMRWIRSDFTQGWVFANDTPGRRLLIERHDLLGALVDIPFQIDEVTGIAAFASIPTAVGIPLTQDCPLDTVLYLRQDRGWVGALAALDPIYVNTTGDTMTGALILFADPTQALEATTKQYVDAADALLELEKVNRAGDTMTGALYLFADPTQPLEAAPKQYVDAGLLAKVDRAGDTMTGFLTLSADPTAPLHAATKQYTDAGDLLRVLKAGDTMTGALTLPTTTPTQNLHAATKIYVDTGDAALQTDINSRVLRAGDTMTGFLTLSAAPTALLHAATKNYVDTTAALRVLKAGDTMTGALILNADPTAVLGATTKQYTDAADLLRVLKAGDTMTGDLVLYAGAPATAASATPKNYVDGQIAAANLYQGTWQVAANVPDLNVPPNAPLNGYSWIAVTFDPQVAEVAPAGIPGIGGQSINNGDTIKWNQGIGVYERIQGSSISRSQADALYLQLLGGTMTGALTLNGDPTSPLHAATMQYVDAGDAALNLNKVNRGGDTMLGTLVLSADPTANLEAATKQYVDGVVGGAVGAYLPLTGGTTTGSIFVPISPNPTVNNELAHKLYVDETVASNSLYQGIWNVASNTPDLTAILPLLNGYSWICQTVDPAVPESPPIDLPGVPATTVIDSGWTIRWNGNTNLYELIRGPSLSLAAAQGYFVDITGDTMTGALKINLDTDHALMLYLNKIDPSTAGNCGIVGQHNGANRWSLYMAGNAVETATDYVGSDFTLYRWNNAGAFPSKALEIIRATGDMTLTEDFDAHTMTARGGGAGGTPTMQMRFGYSNQPNGTYVHEIRTDHHGGQIAPNGIEFWLHGSSLWTPAQTNVSPAINRVLRLGGTQIVAYKTLYVTVGAGLDFEDVVVTGLRDNTQHINLYGDPTGTNDNFGFNVSNGRLNYNAGNNTSDHVFRTGNVDRMLITGTTATDAQVILSQGANGSGYFVGDIYHGYSFDGATISQFREYHGNWDWMLWTNATTRRVLALRGDGDLYGGWSHSNGNTEVIAHQVASSDNRGIFRMSGWKGGLVGGNNEGHFRVGHWMGGWGYRQINFETQVGPDSNCQFWVNGSTSSLSFVTRSSAHLKESISYDNVIPAAVRAFDALKPSRFKFRLPDLVDEEGKPLENPAPQAEPRVRYGFIAEDMPDELVADPDEYGNRGYDIAQLLAVAIAKLKSLEARLARVEGR